MGLMMKVIDLRSDTVTLPSPQMRQAIANAELGDDVFGDDPTVNRLEALAAETMGKEGAPPPPRGPQRNPVGGLGLRPVRNDSRGRLDPEGMRAAIRHRDVHFPRTGLICLENTHNRCGGSVLSDEDLGAVRELASRYALPVHLDGARTFNA